MEETDAWAIIESIAHCAHRLQIKIVACGPIIDFLKKEAEFPGWDKIIYLISPEHADFYLQECLHGRDLFINLEILNKNKKTNIVDILFAGKRGELRFPETELDKQAYENAIRIKPFPNPTPIWIEPEETKLKRINFSSNPSPK